MTVPWARQLIIDHRKTIKPAKLDFRTKVRAFRREKILVRNPPSRAGS